jgi:hypothetical protein
MNDDRAFWSDANELLRAHGRGALKHAADSITASMNDGDDVAMLRWFEIHERIEEALSTSPPWPIAG